jgi:conjugative transfer signal peptidase TraF
MGLVMVGFLLTVQALNHAEFCFNVTRSMPTGLYRCNPNNKPIRRGMLVSICPPNTPAFRLALTRHYLAPGNCPWTQTQPLLKPVAAVAGDEVLINPQGIWVNGHLLHNSQARSTDSQGLVVQKMLQGTYRVQAGELWLISSHSPRSFDSRYFGPVPLSQIQWIVKPLLTGDD